MRDHTSWVPCGIGIKIEGLLNSCFWISLHQGTFSILCSRIQGCMLSLMNEVDRCVASDTCFVWNAKPCFPTQCSLVIPANPRCWFLSFVFLAWCWFLGYFTLLLFNFGVASVLVVLHQNFELDSIWILKEQEVHELIISFYKNLYPEYEGWRQWTENLFCSFLSVWWVEDGWKSNLPKRRYWWPFMMWMQ